MKINWILIAIVGIILTTGCSKKQRKRMNLDALPASIGNAYQAMVVMDESLNETVVYDSIDYNLAAPYLVVPNQEPVLDLDFVKPADFLGYLKHRRSIVFIGALDQNDQSSRIIKQALGQENVNKARNNTNFRYAMRKSVWSQGQRVFYLFAPTLAELPDAINEASPKIIEEIYKIDAINSRASAYAGGQNREAIIDLNERLGVTLKVPKGFRIASAKVIDEQTAWLRHDFRELSYNILVHVMDYDNESEVTTENLIKVRNELGKKYITSNVKGAYMTTELDNRPLPVFKTTTINGNYAIEARGLWKMVNDYMGGAFLSYMVYNPNSKQVVFIDAFLHAPAKKRHRNYVERLDEVLKTLVF
ncbi:MAG: DUF4837 family protein [Saprospiraceae bacterium]